MKAKDAAAFLYGHGQFIAVLAGCLLIAASMGTYTNWDAQLEYEAASNVLTHGFPVLADGLMINQPPLGFYLDAPFFGALGTSYTVGVAVATFFGLGSVSLIYVLGILLYSKRTGLVAAALFGVAPWHVYMSRIFLIDNQCLFFSLLFLIVAVLAIRQNSGRKILAAGVLFALAFLTKLFAVFMLIPLLIIIYSQRAEGFKLTLRRALTFLAPSFALQAIWFGGLANQNFFGVYFSSDFTHPELIVDPYLLFLPRLLTQSAGWFLFYAGLLALATLVSFRHLFAKTKWSDLACVGAIAAVAGMDLLLVFGFHLRVPYVSAFKYNYIALPFFCLLAASIVNKAEVLVAKVKPTSIIHGLKLLLVGSGLVLLFAALAESLVFLNEWEGFVAFEVDTSGNYFPLNVYSPVISSGLFEATHYVAISIIVVSILFPFIIRGFKRGLGWLGPVLSS